MQALELKVPPPVVGLIIAIGMWWIAGNTGVIPVPRDVRIAAAATIAIVGVAFSLAGVISFRNARTTVNPMKPQATSSLVSSGVYRLTRNPMYLGVLLVLIAWAVWLASAWALLGPVVFALYITRFQIVPEERALAAKFGGAYDAYRKHVRRWI